MIELYDGNNSAESGNAYEELRLQYIELQEKYNALLREFEEFKQSRTKAGRRPNDEKWTAKYEAFAALKQEGYKREEIQQKLNMSRATYFRYNKIYTGPEPAEIAGAPAVSEKPDSEIPVIKKPVAEKVASLSHEELVLDEETGEYVTPEGLKRRRKLAAIRARRAAEEQAKALEAEKAAEAEKAPETDKAAEAGE